MITAIIIGSTIIYALIGMFIGNILDLKTEFSFDTALIGGIFWPMILPVMLFIKCNNLVRNFVKKEKYKKLLIFKDKNSTITVNTKVAGR